MTWVSFGMTIPMPHSAQRTVQDSNRLGYLASFFFFYFLNQAIKQI
jgi:hypothetical protein